MGMCLLLVIELTKTHLNLEVNRASVAMLEIHLQVVKANLPMTFTTALLFGA